MASTGRPSVTKRNREQAQRENHGLKVERRAARAAEKKDRQAAPPGEDPDIAGIVPGPQPKIDE